MQSSKSKFMSEIHNVVDVAYKVIKYYTQKELSTGGATSDKID